MIAKLIVEGKEFPIEISDPELQKLLVPPKKTGYERVELDNTYYYDDCNGSVCNEIEERHNCDNISYDGANYYSDKTVAKNNARADKLMRQLRRFAVEHKEDKLDWSNLDQCKYYIWYNGHELDVDFNKKYKTCGVVYFDSSKNARSAIKVFHDELIWYFTEYKDSL